MQHASLEEYRTRTLEAMQSARRALKDDYKLVDEENALVQQLMDVNKFPAQVDVEKPNIK